MVKARLLGAVGIVAVVVGVPDVLSAQAPAGPAPNGTRLAVLPDNPCDLLTREQVAIAAGLPITNITDVQRVPDIHAIVQIVTDLLTRVFDVLACLQHDDECSEVVL